MKKYLLIVFALLFSVWTMGQSTANYAFSTNTTGSLALDMNGNTVDMTTGTTQLVAGSSDGTVSSVTNIGFNFQLMGNIYSQFSASADGLVGLGSVAVSGTTISGGSSTTPKISAMAGDLYVGAAGKVHYKLVGTAPNRCLVVEFNNMAVFYSSTASYAINNYQVRLYETSGVVELVYGRMYCGSTTYAPGTVGFTSGTATNTIAAVTTSTNTVSLTTVNTNSYTALTDIANLNSLADGSRRVYTFTPPATPPADPTTMTFSALTATTITVNWVDNSTNETGFILTRALDAGFTSGVVTTNVASTTSAATGGPYLSAITGLQPGTTYYFKVVAVNEARVSSPGLTGNQATNSPNNYISTATGGLWSVTTTWSGGVVPTASDNATIVSGATVSVDASTNTCYSLTIDNGGTVNVSGAARVLTVNNNLTNNGILDLGDATLAAYSDLKFAGAYNSTFSGTGSVTDIYTLTIAKGTGTITNASPVLDISPTNLTVKNVASSATVGFMQTGTFNGIVKFSGTYTLALPAFLTASYSIPSTGGFWLNNPNFTVTGLNGSPTMSGLLRISAGTFNIGTATGNSMGFSSGSIITVEGGTIVAAGRFGVGSASNTVNYTQSGGNIIVCTFGNTSTTLASFDLGTSATTLASLTGGTITVQLANTGGSGPRDFRGATTAVIFPSYTGTTLYLGNASSPVTPTAFFLTGAVPPMVITTTSAVHKAALAGSVYYYGDLTIPAGSELNFSAGSTTGYGIWVKGNVVNNGNITVGLSTSGSRFDFSAALFGSALAQTYSGTGGTFGVAANPVLSVGFNNTAGVTVSLPMYALRINAFTGTIIGSGNITLGNGTSGAAFVQRGVGATTLSGEFDAYPVLNLGATGTYSVLYSAASAAATTGYEIPVTRLVNNLTMSGNTFGVTLAGGNLTIGTTAAAGLLTLTTGILHTGGSTIFLPYTGVSISGGAPTSFVDGKLSRTFAASRTATGTYSTSTYYPIGKGTTYLPLYVDPTTKAGGAVNISGEAFLTNSGTFVTPVTSLSADRWEALVDPANVANFTSAFIQIGDAAIVTGKQILQAPSAAGQYDGLPVVSAFATGTPNTLTTTGSQITSYTGYFAYGDLTPCSVPGAQPTILAASYITATGFIGSFTAPVPAPSNYLVVRYASGGVVTNPVNYTAYTVGAALGAGTVRSVSNSTTFTETGLTANTTYDYYVYSYNNSGCFGPVYLTTSPLFKSVLTCAAAVVAPGTPTSSLITLTGFTASWAASSTAGVSYLLDVATNSTFTSFVSGFNGLDVGVGTLTYPVTGLSPASTYYVRVRANSGGTCYSDATSTLTVNTLCNPYSSLPWTEGFEGMASVGSKILPTCMTYELVSGTNAPVTSNTSGSYYGPHNGTNFVYTYYAATTWLYTPPMALTAGVSYDFSFYMMNKSVTSPVDFLMDVAYGSSNSSAAMTNVLATGIVCNNSAYTLFNYTIIPATSGTYYFGVKTTSATSTPWYLSFDDFAVTLTPPPTVTTTVATLITGSSASSGGVASGGGITARGVCWSTSANPTIANSHTTDGTGTGSFTSLITGLSVTTLYHYRAYATNIVGTSYGDDLTFTTINAYPPTVTMGAVTAIVTTTATAAGNVTADGGSGPITENGFVYATTVNPQVGGVGVTKVSAVTPGLGAYSIGLTGLTPATKYYINAYAINSIGTAYGTETNFTTYGPPVVTTTAATAITSSAAASGGNVTADGNDPVTARGVCWGLAAAPTTAGDHTTDGTGLGIFSSTLSPLTSNTLYYYRAYATNTYGTSYGAELTFTTQCGPFTVTLPTPYDQNFESVTPPAIPTCTSIQNAGTGNNWITAAAPGYGFTTKALKYAYNSSNAANAWFFTQGLNLTGGISYRVTYNYGNNSTSFPEKLKVAYGSSADYTAMTTTLADHNPVNQSAIQTNHVDFTPATTGTYFIGFNAYSDMDEYYLFVDNIHVEVTPLCPAPSALSAVPGNYFATLSWTAGGSETLWDIEYGAHLFTPTGIPSTGYTGVTNPKLLTGLTPLTSYDYYVRADCGTSQSTWTGPYNFTTTVACPAPTTLTVSGIETTSAKLGWTETGTATMWDIEVQPAATAFTGTATATAVTENPYNYGSLLSGTAYHFQVRSNCGSGSVSAWAGNFSFETVCTISTAPFAEHFNAQTKPACWSLSGTQNWIFTNTWPDYGADLVVDHTANGGSFAGVDGSGTAGLTGITLLSPFIDVSALTTERLRFYLFNNDIDNPTVLADEQKLTVNLWNGTSWVNNIYTWDYGQNAATWQEILVNLVPYAPFSGPIQLQFVVDKGATSPFYDDMIIDDIYVENVPLCNPPTALTATGMTQTTVNLAWTAASPAPASGYEWEIRSSGLPGSGSPTASGTTAAGITSVTNAGTLAASTSYYAYVRSACGGGAGFSEWISSAAFTTVCATAALPISESLPGATFPTCWTQEQFTVTTALWSVATTSLAGGSPNEFHLTFGASGVSGITRLMTPGFNTAGVSKVILSFKHFYNDYSTGVTMKVQSSSDKVNWTDESFSIVSGGGDVGPTTASVSITNNLGAVTYLAFTADGITYNYDAWNIDDISIITQPAVDLELTSMYQTAGSLAPLKTGDPYAISTNLHSRNLLSALTTGSNAVPASNVINTTLLPNATIGSGSRYPVTPVGIEALLTNNGSSASAYTLNWAVDGVAQTAHVGPSVAPNGGTDLASLSYTPTDRGTFMTTGSVVAAGDAISSNNNNSFRMRVYPDTYTRLGYDRGDNVVDTYIGWGTLTQAMKAGVRFNAATDTKLAGVDMIYTTEAVSSGTITVEVRAAGTTTLAPGAVIYSKTYTSSAYFPNAGGYITFAFDNTAPVIAAGSDYWVTVMVPVGINFPGGAQGDGFTSGHSFYESSDGTSWSALEIDDGTGTMIEYAWMMRTINVTAAIAPTVTTAAITGVTYNGASGGGNVTTDGGAAVSAHGVCWNTTGSPTIADSKTTDGSGTGAFTSTLGSLTAGTLYHVRAYATNSVGTAYGNEVTFTTDKVFNLTLFLEGLCRPISTFAGIMETAKDADAVTPHFGAGIADQVNIELRDGSGALAYGPYTANLNVNGSIAINTIPGAITGSYYIVVKNRNHVETWSSAPVDFSVASPVTFNFGSSLAQAYNNKPGNDAMKLMGGVYVIWGGEANPDGIVDASDMSQVFNASKITLAGYNIQDVNGDGIVDASDMSLIFNNSKSPTRQVQKPF
jgi:hypothetical protein